MPLTPIRLKPGINSVQTPTLNESGWAAGSNIRFFQGMMQKDAGFVDLFTSSAGIIKALKAWTALSGQNYLGVGAQNALQIWNGAALTTITPSSGWIMPSSIVTLDNWGEFLMACATKGPIFVWQPAVGGLAAPIPGGQAPPEVGFLFIGTQEQQIVACGMTNPATGIYDPMLVGWCDVGNYQTWTAGTANQAGTFRLAIGSALRAGLAMFGQNLLWTDTALYSMSYIQYPLVYGFQPLGVNCGAVGPHSVGILAGQICWMGPNQFFTIGPAGPIQIDCPVWDQVFPQADPTNLINTTCQTDSYYGEIGWMVLQRSGQYVFARVNLATGAWTADVYQPHTAWIDQNPFGAPIAGHDDGVVDQHDIGYDANGVAAPWSATTGIIMIAEGEAVTFVQDLLPDFATDGTSPTVSLMVNFYDYPNSPPRAHGPFLLTPTTPVVHPRGRGRGVQFVFSGSDLGTFTRLGNVRYRGAPDGKR
jgi:hypothetical protein